LAGLGRLVFPLWPWRHQRNTIH